MLEVKDLVRIYKPKKGEPVRALDGVTLSFPDTGMIFLLGKSGSGKSTLLNVMGGLDKYDGGEIIIKDKSSKDFSQDDFDSYRNTYLGFIFQEYNILNEFSVGVNIGLALQLQGKKVTAEAIDAILDEVDLVGYGNRNPNELSGGQKQRVAIARALVKNPQIIMADEPTGALDSATGLQVFDTLKKLSKDKLVIVVTHDREFAELYGDRVIELKDGKVVSDISKHKTDAQTVTGGLSITDDSVIQIKKGYTLTQSDLSIINSYLANNDAVISLDDKLNSAVRKAAKLDEDGLREVFRDTDNSAVVSKDTTPFKLIKSRLPYRHSLKMGASSLKHKKIRLAITIFLSLVAFGMFGLADTISAYDKVTTLTQSLQDSHLNYLSFSKEIYYETDYGGSLTETGMTDEDIAKLKSDTGYDFKPVFSGQRGDYYFSNFSRQNLLSALYNRTLSGFYQISSPDELQALDMSAVGRMPSSFDEVAISKYIFSHYAKGGYYDDDITLTPDEITTPEAFLALNPYLITDSMPLKITAIIDTGFNFDRFAPLEQDSSFMDIGSYMLQSELRITTKYGYHTLMFVKDGFIQNLETQSQSYYLDISNMGNIYLQGPQGSQGYYNIMTAAAAAQKDIPILYFGEDKTLGQNEILLNIQDLSYLSGNSLLYTLVSMPKESIFNDYIYANYESEGFDTPDDFINALIGDMQFEEQVAIIENIYYAFIRSAITDYLAENPDVADIFTTGFSLGNTLYMPFYSETPSQTVVVKGIVLDSAYSNILVTDDSLYGKFADQSGGRYSFALANMPNSQHELKKLVQYYYSQPDDGTRFVMRNEVSSMVGMVNSLFEDLSKVFLYVGLGLALFAGLMLTNYISTSITYKKREIGILRAVGARRSDVFGIFFNEALIIALINYVLALVAVIAAIIGINVSLRNNYGLLITFLIFGIRQAALMLGVSLLVAFLASLLPVARIARKRPVDAINNR